MSKNLHLHQIALVVTNLDEAIAFYRDTLGLSLIYRFPTGTKIAFFDLGGPRLMLEESSKKPQIGIFYLYVEELEDFVDELQLKGVPIHTDASEIFEDTEGLFGTAGETEYLAFIQDPSENLVGLMCRK